MDEIDETFLANTNSYKYLTNPATNSLVILVKDCWNWKLIKEIYEVNIGGDSKHK